MQWSSPTLHNLPQRHTTTHSPHSTILITAATRIVDAIAVTDIETALAAIPPDRVLDEPGEGLRKGRIELPGIDPLRDGCCSK